MTKDKQNKNSNTLKRLLTMLTPVFILVLAPVFAHSQFVRINLNIPTQTNVTGIEPVELNLRNDLSNETQTQEGTLIFSISASGNMQVQVTLETIKNQKQPSFTTNIAWCNDGSNQFPEERLFKNGPVNFPLSKNWVHIENLKSNSTLLKARVFVNLLADVQKSKSANKYEIIDLKIEYN